MEYTEEQLRTLHKTPVTEEDLVDISNLVPNTLYLYKYSGFKALAVFIGVEEEINGKYIKIKELTDLEGEPANEEPIAISPYERDQYKFYKIKSLPLELIREIKPVPDTKDTIPSLARLSLNAVDIDDKVDYYRLGVVRPRGGLNMKRIKHTKKFRKRKSIRSFRGRHKTKNKGQKNSSKSKVLFRT